MPLVRRSVGRPTLQIPASDGNPESEDQMYSARSHGTESPRDLLGGINGFYRIVDLISDSATGTPVDKFVIPEASVKQFANTIEPRSCKSSSEVDFQALDKHVIRPYGVYGSSTSLVAFLENLGLIDRKFHDLLLTSHGDPPDANHPLMRPGLYLVDARNVDRSLFYVVFWPEETTWDQNALYSVVQNRVTIMRYLTKLCDQLVCLISDEHLEKLVWKDDAENDRESDDEELGRFQEYSVEETQRQEDSVSIYLAFSAPARSAEELSEPLPPSFVVGSWLRGILHVRYVNEAHSIPSPNRNTATQSIRSSKSAQPTEKISKKDLVRLGIGEKAALSSSRGDDGTVKVLHDHEKSNGRSNGNKEEFKNALDFQQSDPSKTDASNTEEPVGEEGSNAIQNDKLEDGLWGRMKGLLSPRTHDEKHENWMEYTFYPMEVSEHDLQEISVNSKHICQPAFNERQKQTFRVSVGTTVRCIVVTQDKELLRIFYASLSEIRARIESGKPRKTIQRSRMGEEILIDFDESTGLLALLSRSESFLRIHLYTFENNGHRSASQTFDLSQWYTDGIPSFSHLVFVPSARELLLVDTGGTGRMYSLNTTTFRAHSVQLDPNVSLFATLDGTGLLVVAGDSSKRTRLQYLSWTSFGTDSWIELSTNELLPSSKLMALTSIGHPSNNYLIFLEPERQRITSLLLQVVCGSETFSLLATQDNKGANSGIGPKNLLIDCHAEVWQRFPICPPIRRESPKDTIHPRIEHPPRAIKFVARELPDLKAYFQQLISAFESHTPKPTHGILQSIRVTTTNNWSPMTPFQEITEYRLGDWLIGLIVLIPIHIAVTRFHRFIPLSDGVYSEDSRDKGSRPTIKDIVERLSFGWYESIFNSYLADRPVKVVTSMGKSPNFLELCQLSNCLVGEQSVGKSYALNHFVDTSFAGSAMRCTEGVWLSLTPTQEHLIVILDFEGRQQFEDMSPDMLLVLFNAAISNLVLFRNNYAVSRDINDLFTSFQSCRNTLNPAENPGLFQSSLAIIIKDVTAPDAKDVTKEFESKFEALVAKEKENNFITKLHKGKLRIITWGVIGTPLFYKLFNTLKKIFMSQATTYPYGRAFLILLKTLMAKIKVHDWKTLEQTLATHRAQQLASILDNAICFGLADPASGESLQNYDNGQPIPIAKSGDVFFLSGVVDPVQRKSLIIEECLMGLRVDWVDKSQRNLMSEEKYVASYRDHLQKVAKIREDMVSEWLKVNTSSFTTDNAEVQKLFRNFEKQLKGMKLGLDIAYDTSEPKYNKLQRSMLTNS
ncbi:hypothetical protein FRC17_007458 [Serendipita sp. 399]|nr:hypothetical protein FRC17_007458 [Serendipita sp. 399]